jgi:hypothetical protein
VTIHRRSWKFTTLFVCLISALVIRPFLADGSVGRSVFLITMTVFFVTAIRSLSGSRWPRRVAVALGILCIAIRWVSALHAAGRGIAFGIAGHIAEILFIGFVVAMLLRAIFHSSHVTADEIAGAFAGYMLIALAFGLVFSLVELTNPASFRVEAALKGEWEQPDHREWLLSYFSCCTLMTIGYGDITPIHPAARAFSVLEGMTGQLYLAVLVAVLVGVRVAQATHQRDG